MARPSELVQVLINLIGNALDAVSQKEKAWVSVAVETAYKGATGKVSILVTDCGGGIPEQLANQIMQPFFTTKELGKGNGLGLSLSRSLVESHGGRLYYDSRCPNTRFVVELPLPAVNQVAA